MRSLLVRLPDGQQQENDDGEDHLEVRDGREAERAHNAELQDLEDCEEVHPSLWHASDVVVRWIGRLFSEQQQDSVEQLIACQRRDGQVQEETIQDGRWDVLQWFWQHKQR